MSGRGLPKFPVGDCGQRLAIDPAWRVLDVGSGQSPFVRADVLLERYVEDNRHRAGDAVDAADPRLVVGDALAMPFRDGEFDYAIASHIAEHVDDPAQLCRELTRVARRGYIETPGWLADLLLREPFHIWRVRRTARGLDFQAVTDPRPLGVLGDLVYAIVYAGIGREGHRTLRVGWRALDRLLGQINRFAAFAMRSRPLRSRLYVTYEWDGPFETTVRR